MARLNLVYLHAWLLQYIQRDKGGFDGISKARDLKKVLSSMIKHEHVRLFTGDDHNYEIRQELERSQRTLWASLELVQIADYDIESCLFHHVLLGEGTTNEVSSL